MATHMLRRSHRRQAREPLSIPLIFSAMSKTLENAQELIEDADLLLSHNRYPRAYALAHLAREELIKCVLLFPAALELARDHRVDWEEINRRLTEHPAKIKGTILLNFMLNPPPDGAYQANELSQQMNTVPGINDMKNYSLYASQNGQEYVKPSERIDEQEARACVSDARGLLQEAQMFYSILSALTGLTEEGLRRCIATPAFQALFQFLGATADLSHFPVIGREQAMVEMTAIFNDPALQDVLAQFSAQFSPLFEQVLQSPNQSNGDDPQASDPTSDHSQEGILRPEQ